MAVSIEELAMNAWPAQHTVAHGGWLLRLAEGYTKRANSVLPFYGGDASPEALQDRIAACEAFYERAGQDTIFKLTTFSTHGLDQALDERGYLLENPSLVLVLDDIAPEITAERFEKGIVVEQGDALSYDWLEMLCSISGIPAHHEGSIARIMNGITMKTGYFTLHAHGCIPAACGFAVIEGAYVGLFSIATSVSFRGQGYGEQLVRHMLRWAGEQGATSSYLQVEQANLAANRLYAKLNYRELYPYWYRVKRRKDQ